jgi:HlyD family secretion protein
MSRKRSYGRRRFWIALLITISVCGVSAWKLFSVKADKPAYIFGTVNRGDIVTRVTAQGTLAAVTTVDVGTQVSGRIARLYADFNSEVKKGQILAKLEPDLFQADVDQQEANVRTAEAVLNDDAAAIASSKANLEGAKVDVLDKQHKYSRQKELFDQDLISRDDYETALDALDSSVAAQKALESQMESAQARYIEDQAKLQQARGALESAKLNLEHSIIYSPISGTVINRAVDVGQTVAASFSAPVLFSIGEDLTKMQVDTSIDEADVGDLRPAMTATFTVDAYPGRDFAGKIREIRLAATTVQNVVTYDAVIDVPNHELLLKPGMTANVSIVIDRADAVLKIPNSALRFKPSLTDVQMAEAFKKSGEDNFWNVYRKTLPTAVSLPATASGGNRGGAGGSGLLRDSGIPTRTVTRGKRVPLWVLESDSSIEPVVIRLGITDGVSTQIEKGKLKQGDKIIVGYEFDPNLNAHATRFSRPFGFR